MTDHNAQSKIEELQKRIYELERISVFYEKNPDYVPTPMLSYASYDDRFLKRNLHDVFIRLDAIAALLKMRFVELPCVPKRTVLESDPAFVKKK